MKGRSSLPGASELFGTTDEGRPYAGQQDQPSGLQLSGLQLSGLRPPGPGEPSPTVRPVDEHPLDPADRERAPAQREPARPAARPPARRRVSPEAERRPTGRERHDEKITVYVSAEELMDLERARLTLRGEHGLAVDRGRIVREALAMVLADLEVHAEASALVRRLSGT